MKRRECLTILSVVIAGPLVARTPHLYSRRHPANVVEFDGATDYLERMDISGLADSKTRTISVWFSNGEYFDLSTREGRIAALNAEKGKSRWVGE